jgi:hypothetical protein
MLRVAVLAIILLAVDRAAAQHRPCDQQGRPLQTAEPPLSLPPPAAQQASKQKCERNSECTHFAPVRKFAAALVGCVHNRGRPHRHRCR